MESHYLNRFIEQELQEWVRESRRKPLLLRGARQVGKTTVVRKLSESFENFLEVNFEENKEVHGFFETNLSPGQIIENLSLYYGISIMEEKTLVFFDEVQACPGALSSMRFFQEKKPGLHLIAAGSLLEFALQSLPSYGVGRIRSMFMFPLSFDEFLMASGEENLIKKRREHNPINPINEVLHKKLIGYLKKFIIIGGMPEVVRNYLSENDIVQCQRVIDDLIISYTDDFAKYKEKVPASRLTEVFKSAILQLGRKFNYTKASPESNHYQIKEALDLLIKAGLIIPVTHSYANGIPLGAEVNQRNRKMLVIDTGIAQRMAGLDIRELIVKDEVEFVNRGGLAEMFTGLEILKSTSLYERKDLYFWQRQALNSNAEVDYLVQKGSEILPLEVKAGTKGSMQSIQIFLEEKKIEKGIRISLENYASYKNILVYPMYAIRDLLT